MNSIHLAENPRLAPETYSNNGLLTRLGNLTNLAKVGVQNPTEAGEWAELRGINSVCPVFDLHDVVVEPDSMYLAQNQALRTIPNLMNRMAPAEHSHLGADRTRQPFAFDCFRRHTHRVEFGLAVGNAGRGLRNLFAVRRIGQMDDEITALFDIDPSGLLRAVSPSSELDN